jgi:hypothetical protein
MGFSGICVEFVIVRTARSREIRDEREHLCSVRATNTKEFVDRLDEQLREGPESKGFAGAVIRKRSVKMGNTSFRFGNTS